MTDRKKHPPTERLNWEFDRMLQEEYDKGMFSPRKRVKLGRTCLVILKLDPPYKGWDYP